MAFDLLENSHRVGEYGRAALIPSATGRTERRVTPRVRVQHRLPGSFTTSPAPVLIRNISLGGVRVESAEPFHVGAIHQFRIGSEDAEAALPALAAETIYCQGDPAPDGDVRFLTGFKFLRHQEEIAQQRVVNLVETSGDEQETGNW